MKQDSAWKDVLETLFPEFLAFFFPEIYRDLDWHRGFTFLDKELQKILKTSKVGKRVVDKLVKVYLQNGAEKWLLIHIEIQGRAEVGFAQRVYVYNYRIFDRFRKEVISLGILSDTNTAFRENEYRMERWGFRLVCHFPIVKLLDYAAQWEMLEQAANPFARVVQTFLKTVETEGNDQERYRWKRRFLLNLYDSGLSREKLLAVYRFIEWIMILPAFLEERILEEVIAKEEKEKMGYILYAERRGLRKGRKEGREAGKKEGIKEGIKEGRTEGLLEGLQQSIYDILEIRFGEAGLILFEKIETLKEIDPLQEIRRGLKEVRTLEEAREVIKRNLPD